MLSPLPPFELERYFAEHEFTAPYLMCCSDVEALTLAELLALADDEGREWWAGLRLAYCDYPGDLRLRQEIASLYSGAVAPDEIYCFAGAQEAIYLLFQVLLRDGGHCLVTWPGYQSLYQVAQGCGAEVSLLELRQSEGWKLSLDQVRQQWRADTRLLAVNFPHNPTGAVLSSEELRQLAEFCQERGAWLFSDEVYWGTSWREPDVALAQAVELSPRAISLGVMSKSFGLAGLRVGWVACRDHEVLRQVAALKDYTSICNAAPSEALAFVGLRARRQLWRRAHAILSRNTALFQDLLDEFPNQLGWVPPQGGTMGFPRLQDGRDVARFARDLRQEQGVLILPGSVYGHSGNHFRVGLGRENFPDVLRRFRRFLTAVE